MSTNSGTLGGSPNPPATDSAGQSPAPSTRFAAIRDKVRAGAVVLPASPSFYSKPETLDSLLDTVVGRVLDQLGLANKLMPRWGESPEKGEGKT